MMMKSPEIGLNRCVRCKNSFILKSLFNCQKNYTFFVKGTYSITIKVPLTSSTKTTWCSCCPLETSRSKATQFWGLLKITKHIIHLRDWERNKSKQPIPITHCATRLINIEYDLVVYIPRLLQCIVVVLPLD